MRPRRQDANHGTIRDAFRKFGCSWVDLHELGMGRPDGVAGYGGLCVLVEIKDAAKPPSKRRLTKEQQSWWARWSCGGIWLVETSADVEWVVRWLRSASDAVIAAGVSREYSASRLRYLVGLRS